MENIIFEEKQKFKQRWLWVLLLATLFPTTLITVYALYTELFLGMTYNGGKLSAVEAFIIAILGILLPIGLLFMFKLSNLLTQVRPDGVYFKYFPFINSFRTIKNEDIKSFQAKQYSALGEFGGWGIRYSFATKTKCYNVSGNLGVLLELHNGKKILFGSQKPQEFAEAINKILTK